MTDMKTRRVYGFEPRVIQGGKSDPKSKQESEPEQNNNITRPISELVEKFQNLDPSKAEQFNGIIKSIFKRLQKGDPPKIFQCKHCGGFHSLEVHCEQCDTDTKAQEAFTMSRPDHIFAVAMCDNCLAVSVAIFKCHGIDPDRVELQSEYVESAKSQRKNDD